MKRYVGVCAVILSGGMHGARPSSNTTAAALTAVATPTTVANVYPRDATYNSLSTTGDITVSGVIVNNNVTVNVAVLYGSSSPLPDTVARRDSTGSFSANNVSATSITADQITTDMINTSSLSTQTLMADTLTTSSGTIDSLVTGTLDTSQFDTGNLEIANGFLIVNATGAQPLGQNSGIFVSGTLSTGSIFTDSTGTEFLLTVPNSVNTLTIQPDSFIGFGFIRALPGGGFTASLIETSDFENTVSFNQSQLATLGATGLVANSATTATDLATPNTLVARDAWGGFSAGTITASYLGAVTAAISFVAPETSLGTLSIANNLQFMEIQNNILYAIDPSANELLIFDISTPSALQQVGAVGVGGSVASCIVSGAYVYVSSISNNTLTAYDVSNPTAPVVTSTLTLNGGGACALTGSYLYLLGSDGTLNVINADPLNLSIAYTIANAGNGSVIACALDKFVFFGTTSGGLAVTSFDLSFPDAPVLVQTVSLGGYSQFNSLQVRGNYLYVCVDNAFAIYLVSSAFSYPLESTTTGLSSFYNLLITGDYAYVSDGTVINVYSIANSSSPALLAQISAVAGPQELAALGGNLFVTGNNQLAALTTTAGSTFASVRASMCDADEVQVGSAGCTVSGFCTTASGLVASGPVYASGISTIGGHVYGDATNARGGTLPALVAQGSSFTSACVVSPIGGTLNPLFIDNIPGGTGTVLVADGAGNVLQQVSSKKFKERIASITDDECDAFLLLRPVSYEYTKNGTRGFGFIAEEVAPLFPSLVHHDSEGRARSVDYHGILALALAEHQRQRRECALLLQDKE